MKTNLWTSLFLATLLLSPSLSRQIAQAETLPLQDWESKTETRLEGQDILESQRLLPALPEPEAHKQARVDRAEQKVTKAKADAQAKSETLMQERQQLWEEAFPVVEGEGNDATFINAMAKDAVLVARDADLYPSVLIAQAGLESGWGKSGLATNHHNLFGIKGAFNGETATLKTWEDVNGAAITIHAGFRSYPSITESLLDYAQLLSSGLSWSPDYYQGVWRSQTESHTEATSWLTGRYATDTRYDLKLNDIIARYDLTRFDDVKAEDTRIIDVEPVITPDAPLTDDQYRVEDGDTVQLLLYKTGLSLEVFMTQNEMDSARIHVNQILSVREDEASVETEEETPADEALNRLILARSEKRALKKGGTNR